MKWTFLYSLISKEKWSKSLCQHLFPQAEIECVRAERVERETTNSNSATVQPSQTTHTEIFNQTL